MQAHCCVGVNEGRVIERCVWWLSEVCLQVMQGMSLCATQFRYKHIPCIATKVAYMLWSLFYRMLLLHTHLLQCVLSNTHECTYDILVLYR